MSNTGNKFPTEGKTVMYSSDEGIEDIICEVSLPHDISDNDVTEQEDLSNSSWSVITSEDDDGNYDNEESDTSQSNSNWSETDMDPLIHEFTGQEGLKVNLSVNNTTFDAFSLLFDDTLIEKIVYWTNIHAEELVKTTCISSDSNLKKWTNVTKEEIKKFLGLCIMMGNIRMPNFKSYWSTNILYYHPLFGKTMRRNRFEAILRCLRFYDDTTDKTNRLHKIDQLLNHLLDNIKKVYYPGQNLLIDEALLLRRGGLVFRQYRRPLKKARYGIKMYELCTPEGFVLNIIYYGKSMVSNNNGRTFCIVYKLLHEYLGKGHTIYMDNYYNNVHLATSLYKDKTHVVGTLQKNRKGNPKFLVDKKLNNGELIFARNGNVLVQKWRDKHDVLTISTKHTASFKEVRYKSGRVVKKPCAVTDYYENMSGIDRADQMISYYSSPRKSTRWYIKLFFHLFDITIWNSCLLYNKICSTKISYLDFRNDLVNILLNPESEIKIPVFPQSSTSTMQHFPIKLEKRIRCRVCANTKRRTATMYACELCKTSIGQPIGLCIDKCFKMYHVNK